MDSYSSPNANEDYVPRTEQAALYALGALSQTEARFVERTRESDGTLTAACAAFEQVVGLFGLSAPEQTPAPSVRRHLLNQITATDPVTRSACADRAALAGPCAEKIARKPSTPGSEGSFSLRASEGIWRQFVPGVFIKMLFRDRSRDTVTTLVRLAPGGRLPRHRHPQAEESFIIAGSCSINGETFSAGDYRRAPHGTVDDEVTTDDGVTFLMISAQQIEVVD